MSPQIMNEFLKALHLGLGRLDYGVVGDAALYKYGNGREVSHVEVIVPWDLSHMVVPQVVYKKVGFVFIDDPCFEVGYVASNTMCYGLKIGNDRLLDVSFPSKRKTNALHGSPARFMDLAFLLNYKAYHYCYRTRLTSREDPAIAKKDSYDIAFILASMRAKGIRATREQCPCVIHDEFWRRFTRLNPNQEAGLKAIGLQPAPTGHDRTPRSSEDEARDKLACDLSRRFIRSRKSGRSSDSAAGAAGWPRLKTISESQVTAGISPKVTPRPGLESCSGMDGGPTSPTSILRTGDW